ncbi:hypothetical protein ES332_A07G148500v1 [Gossypium tomentosum]|uniref:Pentapeptide repeat-containing protein n=1 Tax=Gossypium tomentosum TaxID=34277 RepID=A0A5D2PW69_GOSTO|nr:hypothetical protein ES332_A07G148500v1 [Gossypium tomentosum]
MGGSRSYSANPSDYKLLEEGLIEGINSVLNKRKEDEKSPAELTCTDIIKCIQSERLCLSQKCIFLTYKSSVFKILACGCCGFEFSQCNFARGRCEFTGANLRGALLAGANLQSANLQDASLIDCSFCGADLHSAHLQSADLTDANLEGANLEGANLKGAKLSNANLKGANLQRAYLRHVNLRDTISI